MDIRAQYVDLEWPRRKGEQAERVAPLLIEQAQPSGECEPQAGGRLAMRARLLRRLFA